MYLSMQLLRRQIILVEYICYGIDSARTEAFEQAYPSAAEALAASQHFERYEVSRCSEDPTQHVVRIEWDSEEGHLTGFRQSPEFRRFFEAVGPFVNDIKEMRHYQVTLASTPKHELWLQSQGQIDFYDDPRLISPAADAVAAFLG
jgi:quinol monooxygenase YgiN